MEVLYLYLPYVLIERRWQVDDELHLVHCVEEPGHRVLVHRLELLAVDLHHLHICQLVLIVD